MTRKKTLIINLGSGILYQAVAIICGFILPRFMLLYYGSSVNGLVASISHYLGFISFLDMGVGAVVQSNLYGPLAKKDHEQIGMIAASSDRFFRRLAYIFIGYIAVLTVIFPGVIGTEYDSLFTISLIVIIAFSTLMEYLLGITDRLLLNADQKVYLPLFLAAGTTGLNTLLAVLLIKAGAGIHTVKLVAAAVFVLRPVVQRLYVKRHYRINRRIKIVGEPIRQKWNGFSQHFATVVLLNVDVAVLSIFSTMANVSVYSVYYMAVMGIAKIVTSTAASIEVMFGNLISNGEKTVLFKIFSVMEWAVHTVLTVVFVIMIATIVPFVSVYTKGIIDANYIVPLFAILLTVAYWMFGLRFLYFSVVKAAGHYKQTQNGSFVSALLNIIITIALVFRFGLVGTAIGTLIAMAYHTCYFVWYLRKNILERSVRHFISHLVTDCIVGVLAVLLTRGFVMTDLSYAAWVVLAVKVSLVVIGISLVINLLFHRKQIMLLLQILKKKT